MDTNSDKDKKITGNPERLQDNDHRMDRRTNDAQGEVDYGQNRHQPNEDPEQEAESHWKAIESDYRKHYPKLTDTDVNYKAGEFSDVPRRIAKRTNRTPEAVSQEIRGWRTKK
ncbi:hypothetical protein [Gelidibacter mesophilus]|uniref:hypothetical protein n=1 Tax=Gelidibacter mesophilus TaxID=169050 RepID=UPI0004167533|nr:hypothetical protein [Gelidibacter mesophilus]